MCAQTVEERKLEMTISALTEHTESYLNFIFYLCLFLTEPSLFIGRTLTAHKIKATTLYIHPVMLRIRLISSPLFRPLQTIFETEGHWDNRRTNNLTLANTVFGRFIAVLAICEIKEFIVVIHDKSFNRENQHINLRY